MTTEIIQQSLEDAISDKLFSCAQCVVADADRTIASIAVGKTRIEDRRSPIPSLTITPNTLFDVASLTKPLVTAALAMKAVDDGLIGFGQKLISIPSISFPSWLLGDSIESLLSHQTQLPAWIDFHGSTARRESHEQARDHFISVISRLDPREDDSSWCYSDLGYMLLGFILENAYNQNLDDAFKSRIAAPLGLSDDMMFTPLRYRMQKEIPATCPNGATYIQGHPDDANARALTHIAGHAGLFATANAITAFVQKLLSRSFPVSAETITHCLTYRSPRTPFALGWDRPTSEDSLSSRKPGDPVLGHLGFTGCSVWFDTETGRIITLLTNRTHTCDDPKAISKLRRELYKIAWNM